eukprot:SAG22_NODE_23764_length_134_cov_46.800000_1_plen_30_part_01
MQRSRGSVASALKDNACLSGLLSLAQDFCV